MRPSMILALLHAGVGLSMPTEQVTPGENSASTELVSIDDTKLEKRWLSYTSIALSAACLACATSTAISAGLGNNFRMAPGFLPDSKWFEFQGLFGTCRGVCAHTITAIAPGFSEKGRPSSPVITTPRTMTELDWAMYIICMTDALVRGFDPNNVVQPPEGAS